MAAGNPAEGGLSTLAGEAPPPATTDVASNAAGSAPSSPAPPSSESAGSAWSLAALQIGFQRSLTEGLKGLKASSAGVWWLGMISFLYGIVHAAGPGHGKVVISSYLLANEERVRRGVGIAFVSAFVQALVAIGIVGVMAIALNMTGAAMTRAAGVVETGSFALVLALGLYLLFRKGRQAVSAWGGGDAHAAHAHAHHGHHHHRRPASRIQWDEASAAEAGHRDGHGHGHAQACSCAHHASPEVLGRSGLAAATAAVFSVGLRPCSGALIVLVFALAQGIFWAGVVSTFLMALGTAITVAVLAALAVGAKDIASRLAAADGRRSGQLMLGLEIAAALLVTGLGAVLLLGSLQA